MTMGTTARLRAVRPTENGLYFSDGETEVLLPRSEVPGGWGPDAEAELFLYRDSEDRPTATRRRPLAQLGQAATLEVVQTGPLGAFARWGLLKDLLIPHAEQAAPLKPGDKVLVLVCLDERSDRLYGTTKLSPHLSRDLGGLRPGLAVAAQVWKLHPHGWVMLVEHRWQGLVYRSEAPAALKPGESVTCWISGLREDGKLDLRLRPQGFAAANPDAETRILEALTRAGGRLALSDASPPHEIQAVLGLSKKAFKAACGTLARRGLLTWADGAIVTSARSGGS